MRRLLLVRLALLVPVLLGVSLIVFLMLALIPGDAALAILGPYATPANVEDLRATLGLDLPLPAQYLIWLGNVLSGDLGWSYSLGRPVLDEIAARIGPTLLLAGAALALAVAAGLWAGVTAAVDRGAMRGRVASLLAQLAIAVPPFWFGLMLILIVSVRIGWLPVSGMGPILGDTGPADIAHHLILPAITLSVVAAGVIARMTRVTMLEVLPLDYIRVARAKGLAENEVVWGHAFRNALVALLPAIGTQIGFVLGATAYVETVFQWPGMGRMIVDAILARDLLLVQGGVLVLATLYVLLNLTVDLAQRLLDPRLSP